MIEEVVRCINLQQDAVKSHGDRSKLGKLGHDRSSCKKYKSPANVSCCITNMYKERVHSVSSNLGRLEEDGTLLNALRQLKSGRTVVCGGCIRS